MSLYKYPCTCTVECIIPGNPRAWNFLLARISTVIEADLSCGGDNKHGRWAEKLLQVITAAPQVINNFGCCRQVPPLRPEYGYSCSSLAMCVFGEQTVPAQANACLSASGLYSLNFITSVCLWFAEQISTNFLQ